jgi:hypothetical protein
VRLIHIYKYTINHLARSDPEIKDYREDACDRLFYVTFEGGTLIVTSLSNTPSSDSADYVTLFLALPD